MVFLFASLCVRCYTENKANDCFVDTKESFSMVLRAMLLAFSVYCLLSRKILLLNSKHFCEYKRTNKRTRAFYLLQKRTESDRIVIGGMDNENDPQKRNAYN